MFLPHAAGVVYNLKMVIPFTVCYTVFGYSLNMGISWLCVYYVVSDMSLRWVYPRLFKYFVVFALRCWTMSYYDIASYVYYVFLDIPLIWACHLSCMVLSDHTSV